MPKFKVLSGPDLIKIFSIVGFEVISQKGSHIKLRRIYEQEKQTLIVPNHKEIDRGTTQAIYRQALKYIDTSDLEPYFLQQSSG